MQQNNKLIVDSVEKRIKIRLIELGMSQVELANGIGASTVYMNRIIKGSRPVGKYSEAIEKILGISLDEFKKSA